MELSGYEALGFNANPFNSNTAEREPQIAEYAVHPPYLDRTTEASKASGIFFLEGARGSGKSATRLTVAKQLFNLKGGPLVVPLIGFNVFRPYVKAGLSIDIFATQVAFLTVETLLSWMASLSTAEQEDLTARVKKDETLIAKFVSNFYLNRADHSRSVSASDTFQLLDTSLTGRASIWTEKRWDQVAAVVARLAGVFGKKYADIDIGDPAAFHQLLEKQRGDGFHDPVYTLARAVEFSRAFGFSGLLIQIDKVDEMGWTGADVSAAADLILPILSNIGLHEIEGLTCSFFVWDDVARFLRATHRSKIRFDKIPHGDISWEVKYLTDLVSRRMSFFSKGRVTSLGDISEKDTDVGSALNEIITLTNRSPRHLISALDHILSAHIQRNQGNPKKLDSAAFDTGMDTYAVKVLADNGLLEEARMVAKLGQDKFVTKDVQDLLRQSAQSARGRIDTWATNGLIRQIGTRATAAAGRPVDEFQILDPAALRILNRGL